VGKKGHKWVVFCIISKELTKTKLGIWDKKRKQCKDFLVKTAQMTVL